MQLQRYFVYSLDPLRESGLWLENSYWHATRTTPSSHIAGPAPLGEIIDNLHTGDRVPEVTFHTRTEHDWKDRSTADYFGGKRVVLFSLPGAFTPTCSASHVPRYQELRPQFSAVGIDDVLCVSVNDGFVMNAWQKAEGAPDVTFVPDGNGDFTSKMGFLVDKGELGFGKRSWRYAMVVNDGVIEQLFIEKEVPGDPFSVSDADTVLDWLDGTKNPDIAVFTKPGCSHCARVKTALTEAGLGYDELSTSPRILRAIPGVGTTPQVFVDGDLIGGADELEAWLIKR